MRRFRGVKPARAIGSEVSERLWRDVVDRVELHLVGWLQLIIIGNLRTQIPNSVDVSNTIRSKIRAARSLEEEP